jgi:hypothetical protein
VADYAALLRAHTGSLLGDYSDLSYEWHETEHRVTLRFPRRTQTGFNVSIAAEAAGVEVAADTEDGGMHVRFDPTDYESGDGLVAHALGLVRDLLSTAMRLRVRAAGGTAYHWSLEATDASDGGNDHWRTEDTMGLLVWPFWRKRTERIFQNDMLVPRRLRR